MLISREVPSPVVDLSGSVSHALPVDGQPVLSDQVVESGLAELSFSRERFLADLLVHDVESGHEERFGRGEYRDLDSLIANPPAAGASSQPLYPSASHGILTLEQIRRYQNLKTLIDHVEALPPGVADPQDSLKKLTTQWTALRQEAIRGDAAALKILQALAVEQMVKELVAPSRQLVRFHYSSFEDLKSTVQDDDRFKLEVQWRALLGLRSFYFNKLDQKNELVPDAQRLFKPVIDLMDRHPESSAVQRWSSLLLLEIYPKLNHPEQQLIAERLVESFTDSPDGPQKHFALRCIPRLYATNSKLNIWGDLLNECRSQFAQPGKPDLKYYLVCALFIGDPALIDHAEKMDLPKLDRDSQMAVAWLLGRARSDRGFTLLNTILKDDQCDLAAREMAIVSLAEYKNSHRRVLLPILNQISAGNNPPVLVEAAQAMQEKVAASVISDPDYYVKALLPEKEQAAYLKLRSAYIKDFDTHNFSIVQKNIIDRTLIPYIPYLEKLVAAGEQHVLISRGAITQLESHKNMIGVRSFDGRLWDTIRGIGYNNGQAVTPAYDLIDGYSNTFAHEFMHHIHLKAFSEEQAAKIIELYKEAVRSGKALNYYAAANDREYLAVANEAYDALYIDHYYLYDRLFNEGFDAGSGHNRSQLRRKDRELFRLLSDIRAGIPLTPPQQTP